MVVNVGIWLILDTVVEDDFKVITENFISISAKYYQFGRHLKISPGELDGIRNEISVHDLLHDVVLEFLRSPRDKFKPTWKTVVSAAFDINPALAKEIAKEHPGRFMSLCL